MIKRAEKLFEMVNIPEVTINKCPSQISGECDLGSYRQNDDERTERLDNFWQKWGGKMGKISGLTLHNIKKEKGQYISFGIVILNTANVNFCIPVIQDTDTLINECMSIK